MARPGPVTSAFRWLAARRRARAFHPVGETWRATVQVLPGSHVLGALAGDHGALVRLSRGAGLPAPLPDVHGIGIRIEADPAVDLLLSTSRRLGLDVPWPVRGAEAGRYSTLTSFTDRTGHKVRLHATVEMRGDLPVVRLEEVAATATTPVATITATERSPEDRSPRLDPLAPPPGWHAAGLLNRLRAAAYAGSRQGAPTHESRGPKQATTHR